MKVQKWLIGTAAAAAGAAAVFFGFRHRKLNEKKVEQKLPEGWTDYQDRDHLIYCPESNLNRRLLPLESAINLRDIGGYTGAGGAKTKWNKMFRSEELSHLSAYDEHQLEDYGINYIFDFRDEKKALRVPDFIPEGAVYENIPILKGIKRSHKTLDYSNPDSIDKYMRKLYEYQVENMAQAFARILHILADEPDAVILFHCTNGKDRTGFMAALILLIAGVPEETIISDYSLTNLTFDEAFETLGTIMAEDFEDNPEVSKDKLRDFFGVRPAWLKIQLDYIRDHFGTVDRYLTENTDLTEKDLNRIRKNITEKEPVKYEL
ncbi:MAG: tyrosine-protein phosphatase [Eubacteriaceae bacterium]|jgi:protein-tyrosine phosphatase